MDSSYSDSHSIQEPQLVTQFETNAGIGIPQSSETNPISPSFISASHPSLYYLPPPIPNTYAATEHPLTQSPPNDMSAYPTTHTSLPNVAVSQSSTLPVEQAQPSNSGFQPNNGQRHGGDSTQPSEIPDPEMDIDSLSIEELERISIARHNQQKEILERMHRKAMLDVREELRRQVPRHNQDNEH
ncbi:hypothetical protein BCR33DRAFT_720399 [Rhizoclosmatium globosum]|uniref:Uncharacterized protein n=1 Tax=Rhizoclosmatium globosum TaxID=329046 RepID=A0A1Y2BWN6_9FUNG|nr:hypothetical protein BCR33DRAFT_720399 [Rhizoclosmatium globosum]|eukprot:ORY39166.1 hypothetical protein BCR33DRAFT_720399 [Rhizoclosmatium globosum]